MLSFNSPVIFSPKAELFIKYYSFNEFKNKSVQFVKNLSEPSVLNILKNCVVVGRNTIYFIDNKIDKNKTI